MTGFSDELLREVRERFMHVELCPYQGRRIFLESAGGALRLRSVLERAWELSALPDNQKRDNPASQALMAVIEKSKRDTAEFIGARGGKIFVGESGSEVLFRLVRSAITASSPGGNVVHSDLEHPASKSPMKLWSKRTGRACNIVAHDVATGTVSARDYSAVVTPETKVATVIYTSPICGVEQPVRDIVTAIRAKSPDCFVILDTIQQAAHGLINASDLDVDGLSISSYKISSRHGYGIGWVSDRLAEMPADYMVGLPVNWELGTRDASSYGCTSAVLEYYEWLGGRVMGATSTTHSSQDRRSAAMGAIHAHEATLIDAMANGIGNQPGLASREDLVILAGDENPNRRGLMTFAHESIESAEIIRQLSERGIRVEIRRDNAYAEDLLRPLGLKDAVRASVGHYNSLDEIETFLEAVNEILDP